MTVDPDRNDVTDVAPDDFADRQPDRGPPRLGVLLGTTRRRVDIGRVAGPGQGEETAIDGDETDLHLGRP